MNRAQRRAAQRKGHRQQEGFHVASLGGCAFAPCSVRPGYVVVGQAPDGDAWVMGFAHVCRDHLIEALSEWPITWWTECGDPSMVAELAAAVKSDGFEGFEAS